MQFLIIKYVGHKICQGTFGNLWTPILMYGDLIFNLFMCFLINQILRNNDYSEM